MGYLVDLTGRSRVSPAEETFRFTDLGSFNTKPTDVPADVHYAPWLNQPGSYRRSLFGSGGRTNGVASIDKGEILLDNMGGQLDHLTGFAFDGRDLVISEIASTKAPYASRRAVYRGTVDQATIEGDEVRLRLRSRLLLLDAPIQTATYAGTTNAGGMSEAEGDLNLKDAPRVQLFGAPRNIPAVLLNRWAQVYGVGHRLSAVLTVRDAGAPIAASGQNFATLAALLAASVPAGQYATCLVLGLIRIGGNTGASGRITVDAAEGATPADRTAGQVVRRILRERANLVENVDFLLSDIAALDAEAPYTVGYWPGSSRPTMLAAVSFILDSVGAYISPDRLGVFRIGRFKPPSKASKRTFTDVEIKADGGRDFRRLAVGPDASGIPASKITIRHSLNHTVAAEDQLSGFTRENEKDFVAFSKAEWRQEESAETGMTEIHRLAKPIVFDTALQSAADAQAMVGFRVSQYGVGREGYEVPVDAADAVDLELDDVCTLRLGRFGLASGKNFVIVGTDEDLDGRITSLEVWG